MSSSEVDGDDGTSVPLAERAVSQDASDSESVVQHRRDVRRCGPARVFLFLATDSGWWANFLNDSSMPLEPGQTILVGAAIASWTFFSHGHAAAHSDAEFFRCAACRTRGDITGFVGYVASERVECEACDFDGTCSNQEMLIRLGRIVVGDSTLGAIISGWRGRGLVESIQVIPVFLAPPLARAVIGGSQHVFHAVAITGRTLRNRFLSSAPSCLRMRSWFGRHGGQGNSIMASGRRTLANDRRENKFGGSSAGQIVDVLRASRHIKDIKLIDQAADAFAILFSRGGRVTKDMLMQDAGSLNREVVRRARVRFDCVSMLAWRRRLATVDFNRVNIHLFADASPQRRGLELFAASFDFVLDGTCVRRLLPFISATLGMDLDAKAFTLLWQFFLVIGPTFRTLRSWCNRVRSVCTDFGTERLFAHIRDVLPAFCKFVGIQVSGEPLSRLFPRALQIPGWHHLWDVTWLSLHVFVFVRLRCFHRYTFTPENILTSKMDSSPSCSCV
jgi:hypothetical protein